MKLLEKDNDSLHSSADADTVEEDLFIQAAQRGAIYLSTIRKRRVAPRGEDTALLSRFGGRFPYESQDPSEVLALLDSIGSSATVAQAGGRYFGFVCGGSLPVARAANVLAAAWDQNAAMHVLSPTACVLEEIALAWLIEVFGLPASTAGAFVTGATVANLTCLAAARHELLHKHGWDVEEQGLFGAPLIPVYVSEEAHSSVLKALSLLGFGRGRVHRLATDDQGRILAGELPPLTEPALVCIQAGNVNSGSFDPADSVSDWAHAAGSWVHVDGAFGLWAAASSRRVPLMRGVDRADSWATDGHKWLNVPYDCGFALVRRRESLRAAMSVQAEYLQVGVEREPSHWGPELSRRARGVEVWAALRFLGQRGLSEMIERSCRQAARFATRLRRAGYPPLNSVVLNQVLVSFGNDQWTRKVVAKVQADGTCWCGSTIWKGKSAMRISVSSWATSDEDVERSADAILRIATGNPKNQSLQLHRGAYV